MDYADSPKFDVVEVHKLTVEDIRRKDFEQALGHLSGWERAECSDWLRYKS